MSIHYGENSPYRMVKRKLIDGEISFGAPIVVKDLESELRCSSIPIREALVALAAEDLIDFHPGHGFSNKPLDADEIGTRLDFLHAVLLLSARSIPDGRKRLLRKRLPGIGRQLFNTSPGMLVTNTAFSDLFDRYFLHPATGFVGMALAQCARFLAIDAQRHDPRTGIGEAAFRYFRLVTDNQPTALPQKLGHFFEIRKARIADTIEAAKEYDLLLKG